MLSTGENKAYTAREVAEFIVAQYHDYVTYERGLDLTIYRLHALLYFSQVYFVTRHDKRLFEDDMAAWTCGAVVPEISLRYRIFGGNRIRLNYDEGFTTPITEKDQEEIMKVILSLEDYHTFDLIDIILMQTPWREAKERTRVRIDGTYPGIVKIEDIKEFFK